MKVCTSNTSSFIEENLQKLCDCPYIYGKNYSLYMFILRFIVMQAEESLVWGAKIHLNYCLFERRLYLSKVLSG